MNPANAETRKVRIDSEVFIDNDYKKLKSEFKSYEESDFLLLKDFLLIVWTIFLLEFADKTQLAAISFATRMNPVVVYLGVILGLSMATVVSVAIGKAIGMALPARFVKLVAGILFIIVGIWTIFGK